MFLNLYNIILVTVVVANKVSLPIYQVVLKEDGDRKVYGLDKEASASVNFIFIYKRFCLLECKLGTGLMCHL